MNKMKLELGDMSNDGHGKTATILLQSNVDVSTIRKAYKDSCYLTDVQFNSNDRFTKTKYKWQEDEKYEAVVQYEDSYLSSFIVDKLSKFGLTEDLLSSFNIEKDVKHHRYFMYKYNFVPLWIWFVKLSLPEDTIIEVIEDDDIPSINNGPRNELNTQIGYGLFV